MTNDFLLDKSDPNYRNNLDQLWAAIQFADFPMIISIKKKTEKRSITANKYYWGVLLEMIAEHTGQNANDLHYFFKDKFIPHVRFGDDFDLTTADMTNRQFWEYLRMIRQFATDHLSIRIPDEYSVTR